MRQKISPPRLALALHCANIRKSSTSQLLDSFEKAQVNRWQPSKENAIKKLVPSAPGQSLLILTMALVRDQRILAEVKSNSRPSILWPLCTKAGQAAAAQPVTVTGGWLEMKPSLLLWGHNSFDFAKKNPLD